MHHESIERWQHPHTFGTDHTSRAETRTWWVIGLTAATMLVEIAGGMALGSMALLADGWHMGTHAAALGVTAYAYYFARKHAHDPRYSFGTGKVGALGGFASAVGLAVVALVVLGESAARIVQPVAIHFDEAIGVAVLGLLINLLCAWLLREDEHGPGHGHGHGHGHTDHNLRAAYLHVLADALTSVLAIAALTTGRAWGWTFMDPVMGVVGALVIARWSVGLLKDTGRVLLDAEASADRRAAITRAMEKDGDTRVTDLHLWHIGPGQLSAIVAVVTHAPRPPEHYKERLAHLPELAHLTVEVAPCRH